MNRPTRLCADILMAALGRVGPANRREVLALGCLTQPEFERALKCLRTAGVIRRSEPRADAVASEPRYELTGKPLSRARARRERVHVAPLSFDGLLSVWAPPRDAVK